MTEYWPPVWGVQVTEQDQRPPVLPIMLIGSLFATGFFAGLGALYRWGEGPLFPVTTDPMTALLIADLVVTAPLSILAAVLLTLRHPWGRRMALGCAGICIYGSAQVVVLVAVGHLPLHWMYVAPVAFGLGLAGWILFHRTASTAETPSLVEPPASER